MQGQGAAEQELSGGEAASTSPGTAERHKPLWKSPSESNTATIVKGINQEPITKTASHLDVKKNNNTQHHLSLNKHQVIHFQQFYPDTPLENLS